MIVKNSIKDNGFLYIFCFLLIMPLALYQYFALSVSIGLLMMTIIFLIMVYLSGEKLNDPKNKHLKKTITIVSILLLHTSSVYVLFGNEPNFSRILPSVGLFGVFIFTIFVFVKYVIAINNEQIFKALKILFHLMLIIGYISLYLINNELAPIHSMSMIFFSEPSHYSLVFIPIALSYLYTVDMKYKILYLLLIFILAISLPSLLLTLGTFLLAFCILKRKYIITFLLIFIISMMNSNILYWHIVNRIDVFSEITRDSSLSLLVYLSGIERGFLDFIYSYGLGIGFNNFGYMGPTGDYTYMAKLAMNGFLLCFNDGSFLFAKLLGELGIIAIVLTLIYIYFLINTVVMFKNLKIKEVKDILFSSFFISFSLYMFVRGMGYFTPITFMFLASVYWYYLNYNKENHADN